MRTTSQSSVYRRVLAEACPEILAEFADVERELHRVGLPVPPASPTDTVTSRFVALLVHATDYDRARTAEAVSA